MHSSCRVPGTDVSKGPEMVVEWSSNTAGREAEVSSQVSLAAALLSHGLSRRNGS